MSIESVLQNKPIHRRTDLISIARSGIQTKEVSKIKEFTSLTDKELSLILPISQRQLSRYDDTHTLNKEITSYLILLIELFQKGHRVFGKEKFNRWLRTPNKVLRYVPLEILDTAIGIELVEDTIGRIEHGVYS